MQLCPGDTGLCLLLLLLKYKLLADMKFASTWDLFEGTLYLVFYPVMVYACDKQYFQGQGVVREYVCSCTNMWADITMFHTIPLGCTSL